MAESNGQNWTLQSIKTKRFILWPFLEKGFWPMRGGWHQRVCEVSLSSLPPQPPTCKTRPYRTKPYHCAALPAGLPCITWSVCGTDRLQNKDDIGALCAQMSQDLLGPLEVDSGVPAIVKLSEHVCAWEASWAQYGFGNNEVLRVIIWGFQFCFWWETITLRQIFCF